MRSTRRPVRLQDINALRKRIDALDAALIATLAKRMALIPSVAAYKQANRIRRYQPAREKKMIKDRRAMAKRLSVHPDLVESLMKRIIKDAHRIEKGLLGR